MGVVPYNFLGYLMYNQLDGVLIEKEEKMGTRSLTKIKGDDGKVLLTIYRQMDGYFSGMGRDLANFVASGTLVNGISMGKDKVKQFNGMGCFAAQLVGALKGEQSGSIYIESNSTKWGHADDEYNYEIFPAATPNGLKMRGRPTGGKWVEIWPLPSIETVEMLKKG